MTTTVPCETVRANVLRDALIHGLRTGCESVIGYAMFLMEHDLQLSLNDAAPEGASRQPRLPIAPDTGGGPSPLPASLPKPESPPLPVPGSPEAIAHARAYVLARFSAGDSVDCRIIYRLTDWDAPLIRRFVTAIQDELRASQGVRGRGRPRTRE
jgi:hypothetical protein